MAKMTEKELHRRARTSFLWWFSVFSIILDKARDLVTPEPNICQIRLAEAYEYCVAMGIPFRCIVVKPRQIGISTFCAGLAYWLMRIKSCFCVIMADDLARSDKLFDIMKRFAEKDQFPWGDGIKPEMTSDDLTVGPSTAEKKTANVPKATRGGTPQVVVATEAAFYPSGGVLDAKETMTALMNSVPNAAGTVVIIESTAKGMAGWFADTWADAKWPVFDNYWKKYIDGHEEGKSNFIRVFVAWWEIGEYKQKVSAEETETIKRSLTQTERELVGHWETIGFVHETYERLAWRRATIINACGNNEIKFREEYPSSPNDPFTVSGSPRFDADGLTYLHKLAATQPYKIGVLSDPKDLDGRPSFIPCTDGAWVQLWELPKVGCKYFISSDVATDEDINPSGSSETERDCHSGGVFRAAFMDERGMYYRARLVGRILPPCRDGHDLYAYKLHRFSQFFGNCPIVVEMNNAGGSLMKALLKLEANVFSRTHIDPMTQKERIVYGWLTDEASRKEIIDHLATSVRRVEKPEASDALEIFDQETVSQMRTFVINRRGKPEAASGRHDDDVLMVAIGFYLINGATTYTEKVIPRHIPKWDYATANANRPVNGGDLPLI